MAIFPCSPLHEYTDAALSDNILCKLAVRKRCKSVPESASEWNFRRSCCIISPFNLQSLSRIWNPAGSRSGNSGNKYMSSSMYSSSKSTSKAAEENNRMDQIMWQVQFIFKQQQHSFNSNTNISVVLNTSSIIILADFISIQWKTTI